MRITSERKQNFWFQKRKKNIREKKQKDYFDLKTDTMSWTLLFFFFYDFSKSKVTLYKSIFKETFYCHSI